MYQSLGTVDASDVGYKYTLSAGFASNVNTSTTGTGNLFVGFLTGTQAADNKGTVLASNDVAITSATSGRQSLTYITTTYTPTGADIGNSVNLGLWVNNTGMSGTGEVHYIADNVTLSRVATPEPGTCVLLVTGLLGLLCYAWRKRR